MVFDDEDVGVTPAVALQDVGVAQGDDEMSSLPALWRCKGVGELGRFSTTRRRRHTLSVAWQDLEVVQDDDETSSLPPVCGIARRRIMRWIIIEAK